MHFVVLGGGPTGVELAGAIAELARETMKGEFRHIDLSLTQITLLEIADRILNSFPEELSIEARQALTNKGVTVRTGTSFIDTGDGQVTILDIATGKQEQFPARTVIWAAGIKASPLGELIAKHTGVEADRIGRLIVNPDLKSPRLSEFVCRRRSGSFFTPDRGSPAKRGASSHPAGEIRSPSDFGALAE